MPSSASGSRRDAAGSALGTPGYMSPEQAAGGLDRLGPRRDVYSWGHALLPADGRPPFEGDDLGDVLRAVQERRVPAAEAGRPVDRHRPRGGLPEGDGDGPEDRYGTRGAGRGPRAVDGRRAGDGLARADRSSHPPSARRQPDAAGRRGRDGWFSGDGPGCRRRRADRRAQPARPRESRLPHANTETARPRPR